MNEQVEDYERELGSDFYMLNQEEIRDALVKYAADRMSISGNYNIQLNIASTRDEETGESDITATLSFEKIQEETTLSTVTLLQQRVSEAMANYTPVPRVPWYKRLWRWWR